jgi:stearoyl-CoA desaturase (delta-9 desaturase)
MDNVDIDVASNGDLRPQGLRARADSLMSWFDSSSQAAAGADQVGQTEDQIDWLRALPFFAVHAGCLGVIWVGVSLTALLVAGAAYAIRMFAITGFYHRYFSHKTFNTSRFVQFVFAVIGIASVQRGPLWWASHHRNHHRYADTDRDPHSPKHGFWSSHLGWFLTRRGFRTDWSVIADLAKFPELRILDRFDVIVPVLLASFLYGLGRWLEVSHPDLHTSGAQLLIWGFFVSTTVLFHATVTINSLAHRFGRRRYETRDTSRNNWLLALITFGEGWHNNHHFFPGSARQGFKWWEIDVTYYFLRILLVCGLIHGLKGVPAWVLKRQPR